MAATIADLGARVLRRLGVAVVAASDRPAVGGASGFPEVAARALQIAGIPVPAGERVLNVATVALADLGRIALERLGVIAADEAPSTEDAARAGFAVSAVHDALIGQGIAGWSEITVPRAVAEEYIVLTAIHLATTFGRTADPAQIPAMEARVRRVAAVIRAQGVAETEAQAVHQSLLAQGFASWGGTEIPAAMAEEYAQLVALRVAPLLGMETAPAAQDAMEARVRRLAMQMHAPALAERAVMSVHSNLTGRGMARWSVFDIPAAAERPYEILAANDLAPSFEKAPDLLAGQMAMRELAQVVALPSSGERVAPEWF
jgi:hypothetical protein